MSLAVVHTRAQRGIDAPPVSVEVHLSAGLPSLSIVGVAETAVKESKERVRSAILNSHLDFPASRITISLAPADLPKEGGRFDLPIAIGILAASGQLGTTQLDQHEFIGELSLSGELRGVRGALPSALASRQARRQLIVPTVNGAEASLSRHSHLFAAAHLLEVCAHLHGHHPLEPLGITLPSDDSQHPDLADVIGQHRARRALEVAAAGGHNILFLGPPGSGKTLLANRMPSILPPLSEEKAVEVAAIHSVAGESRRGFFLPPIRSPHHTASAVALVGGGTHPKPGEISLAHGGILFLDELPEFPRKVLEVMRQPLESGEIHISRVRQSMRYPARCQLIAAMNPCPCGLYGTPNCRCTPDQVQRYRGRISGPLLDRIDIQVEVQAVPPQHLTQALPGEPSAVVRERVCAARERQLERQQCLNAELNHRRLEEICRLDAAGQALLTSAAERLGLTARGWYRVMKTARTIADLERCDTVLSSHIAEALSYRLER